MQSDHHHLNSDSTSHRSIISKPIPPPISIIPLRSNNSLEQTDQYSTQNEEDHNMTARCSQFPPDILNTRSISSSHDPIHSSSRFSSFLNNLNNEPSTWSENLASSSHQTQSFRLDSPGSASTNELSSSCSSLASSNSAFLPSTSKSSTSLDSSKFDSPPSHHHPNPTVPSDSFYPAGSNSLQSNYPPTTPQGYPTYQHYPNLPPQPRHSLPIQYSNPGSNPAAVAVAPPATAFTPSDGSPPLLPPNLFCADSGSRRHTVSAFMAPSALEIGLLARHDLEDTMLKEEKRRRVSLVRLHHFSFLYSPYTSFHMGLRFHYKKHLACFLEQTTIWTTLLTRLIFLL